MIGPIVRIMTQRIGTKLNFGRKLLLAAAAMLAVAGPVLLGVMNATQSRAQSPAAAAPAFEVASVKLNKSGGGRVRRVDPRGIAYTDITLNDCIGAAYGVKFYQISGPDWLRSERYDIVANAASPVPKDQLMRMLQTLLADRFKLTFHREEKELPVYALVIGNKGPKLRKAASEDEADAIVAPDPRGLVFKNHSMAELAEFLSRAMDRPVLDMTGLKDRFDFNLSLFESDTSPADVKRAIGGGQLAASMFTLIQELGLKLESRKAPVEILVIDHAEKVPTEN